MRDKLKNWLLKNADSKYSYAFLFLISFIEASFFLIPPDLFLIPLVLARRNKWVYLAFITTIGSILGALFGYAIGLFFFETYGSYIIEIYNLQKAFYTVGIWYTNNAFLYVFVSAFTIIPFKVFTIAAGLFKINIVIFVLASIIGRGLRFYIISYLVSRHGKYIGSIIYKYFNLLSIIFVILAFILLATFL